MATSSKTAASSATFETFVDAIARAAHASKDGRVIRPDTVRGGFVMAAVHPKQGICMVNVGQATAKDVRTFMRRAGARPLIAGAA